MLNADMLELVQAYVAGEVSLAGCRAALKEAGYASPNVWTIFGSRLISMLNSGFIKVTRVD